MLIGTQSGKAGEVVQAIRKLAGVASVDAVTGPYDAIAIIVAEATNDIGEIIVSKGNLLPGFPEPSLACRCPKVGSLDLVANVSRRAQKEAGRSDTANIQPSFCRPIRIWPSSCRF